MNPVTWQKSFLSDLLAMSLSWKQQKVLCINLVIARAGIAAFGSIIYVREITRSLRTGLHCAQSCACTWDFFSPNLVAFRLSVFNIIAELGLMQESWFGNVPLSWWCWGGVAPVCSLGWCRLSAYNLVVVFNLSALCCEWDCFEPVSEEPCVFTLQGRKLGEVGSLPVTVPDLFFPGKPVFPAW